MAEQGSITGIDHPIIAVRDMAAARASYERLGFTVTPRGSHAEWGTGNWCIMFPSDYLELRGVIEAKQTHNLAEFLKEREGLMGVALGTNDAQASYDRLSACGISPQPVRQLTRNFELPEGAVHPRFSLCFLDTADTPGLMWVVLCQHMTPELLRRPEWLRHANGSLGVRAMRGVVRELEAAASAHRKIFGEKNVILKSDRVTINPREGQAIELLTPEVAESELPNAGVRLLDGEDYLYSITLQVNDLAATRNFLTSSGVEFDDAASRGSIHVDPSQACGVILQFE